MPIRKSRVSGIVASGTTADRPTSPSIGDTFFNGTLGVQEIYTTSGWLPATGANDFNVVLTGSETSVTLDKEYFAGAYTITSALSDNTFDLYLFDTSNNAAGYTKTPSINATSNFNKVVVYGGTSGDLLSFAYKTTFTTATSTADTFAAPYITSVSVADLPIVDDTTTIVGGNFDTDMEVWFDGQNDYSEQAKSVVYGSSTSVVATRPDNLLEDNSPYTVRVVNPGTTSPSGSNRNKLIDGITAGGDPVWATAPGTLFSGNVGDSVLITLSATDPDGGPISYSIASGSLPGGLSLNSSTGEISGTATGGGSSFIVSAIDSGNNVTNRSFSMSFPVAAGGTMIESGGYMYHTFTVSGTLTTFVSLPVEVLLVAGGGGGAGSTGGGAGAGGVFSQPITVPAQSHSLAVGAGGAGGATQSAGGQGVDSTAFGLTATGGGYGGGTSSASFWNPSSGGSGGGGGRYSNKGSSTGAAGISGQGNNGGNASTDNTPGGGGGGAGSAGENASSSKSGDGGAGTSSYSSWGLATSTGVNVSGVYYYGGGGGGGAGGTGLNGAGGIGGGGAGARDGNSGASGSTNTGGGGGSSYNYSGGSGGNGGSGLIIVRYPI